MIGANDVTNPAARNDTSSPIYGMPILDVDKATSVIVMKRSMNPGFAGIDNELYLEPQHDDAVRRRQGLRRQADRRRQDGVSVPFSREGPVMEAVAPHEAYDAVRDAFVAHARGKWTMQPKLYVTNYPAGDFRAMPALGGGHALLKWVTSFPGNPALGLPTVTGLVAALECGDGRAGGSARRGRGHGTPDGRGRRAGGRHALPSRRIVVRRDRVRRERRGDGADARRPR